jgi:flagellar biosynthesis/type III secretory pathway chaperone
MATALLNKVDHALFAVSSFSDFLDRETAALEKSDFNTFELLQGEKIELAQAYQQAILAFEEDADILPTLDESVKDRLRQAHSRFATAAKTNQTTLEVTKNVAERIVNLVMTAAKKTVIDETPSYGANGLQGVSDKIPVYFKLNEVF